MDESYQFILRLSLSVVAGGLIGAEREYVSKSAGLRTLMLISLGSCLFTMCSEIIGKVNNSDRIASTIVTGIGFIGAGVIFKDDNRVKGLTTAAAVWVTAAIGMSIGAGFFWFAAGGIALALFALYLMRGVEERIEKANQLRNYRIVSEYHHETLKRYETMMEECGLKFKRSTQRLYNKSIIGTWSVNGSEKKHDEFIQRIMADENVREFEF